MLKILSAHQTRELDAFTIKNEPIASIDLMERACRAFTCWFNEKFDTSKKIGIVCGTGNNGGDGLGIARLLNGQGYGVKVWIVRGSVSESEDFKKNLKRISGKMEIYEITSSSDKGLFSDRHLLIDALFGSGLSRPVEGIYAQVISCMNQTAALRISVDIPSGLPADSHGEGLVLQAHHTVSFQLPKLAFFVPENDQHVGEWHVVPIGLSNTLIAELPSSYYFLEKNDIVKVLRTRSKFGHKGNYGHALIIAGSYGKMGAAVLAVRAAMRSGLGLLTTHIPHCGYNIMQTSLPECMVSVDNNEKLFTQSPVLEKYNVVSIGPGLGTDPETTKAFAAVLENYRKPMVIDADGLNMLAANKELIPDIPLGSILTPHPKEFERLVGNWRDDFERLDKLKALAYQTKSIVILKGAYSAIADPTGNICFNSTGNPGMATGGSGDVLTGILTGLLAQQYDSLTAARIGTYLHGLAGDLAASNKGMEGLIASDLIDFLPEAFKDVTE